MATIQAKSGKLSRLCLECQEFLDDPRNGKWPGQYEANGISQDQIEEYDRNDDDDDDDEEESEHSEVKEGSDAENDAHDGAEEFEIFSCRDFTSCYDNVHNCQLCAMIVSIYQNWTSREHGDLLHLPLNKVAINYSSSAIESNFSHAVLSNGTLSVEGWSSDGVNRAVVGPSLTFHPIFSDDCTVNKFCDELPLEEPIPGQIEDIVARHHIAYTARIRPVDIDFRLLRKWSLLCRKYHGNVCKSDNSKNLRTLTLRAIDVQSVCITRIEWDDPYVALSYLWGGEQEVRLTKQTQSQLEQPSSSLLSNASRSIIDAMMVAKALDYRYLWVDALCIIQDDDLDKAYYISRMDSVYAHAELTIVASTGLNASAGLPGVRPSTRAPPEVLRTSKAAYVPSLKGLNGNVKSYLGENLWSTRGWTFQERILTPRALFFGTQQVYWECNAATWREELYAECTTTVFGLGNALDIMDDVNISKMLGPNRSNDFDLTYRTLVESYSQRSLSFRSDYLNAFTGVLRHLERLYDQEHFWAIPVVSFARGLCWPNAGKIERNSALHHLNVREYLYINCPFPSWSWVGWIGKIYWVECGSRQEFEEDDLRIEFYRIGEDGKPIPIRSYVRTSGNDNVDSNRHVAQGREQGISVKDIPSGLWTSPLRYSVICFWTECLKRVSYNNNQLQYRDLLISCGPFSDVIMKTEMAEEGLMDAILVSSNTKTSSRQVLYDIMLVTSDEGVAYKHRMISILKSVWEQVSSRVWTAVILG